MSPVQLAGHHSKNNHDVSLLAEQILTLSQTTLLDHTRVPEGGQLSPNKLQHHPNESSARSVPASPTTVAERLETTGEQLCFLSRP